MSNEECLYNVDFICRCPHFENNTEAAVSIFNIFSYILWLLAEWLESMRFREVSGTSNEHMFSLSKIAVT